MSLLKGLTFNPTLSAFARLTGFRKTSCLFFLVYPKQALQGKSLMGFLKSVMPVEASNTLFKMATGF
jgi:hypothetical protein